MAETSVEVLRARLHRWLESNLADMLGDDENDDPFVLPVIEDFVLLVAVSDAAESECESEAFLVLGNVSSYHRRLGLMHVGMDRITNG